MEERASVNTLLEAVRKCHFRQVKLLLEAGTDPDYPHFLTLETPLMYSIIYINEPELRQKMITLLLENRADVNVQNERGQTALMQAAILDQADTTELLVKQPSLLVNLQDENGNTALMYAAVFGYIEVAKVLLHQRHHRQNLQLQNHVQKTALTLAVENDQSAMVSLLCLEINHQSALQFVGLINKPKRHVVKQKKRIKLQRKPLRLNCNCTTPKPADDNDDLTGHAPLPKITITDTFLHEEELPSIMQMTPSDDDQVVPGMGSVSPPLKNNKLLSPFSKTKCDELKLPPIRDAMPLEKGLKRTFSPEHTRVKEDTNV